MFHVFRRRRCGKRLKAAPAVACSQIPAFRHSPGQARSNAAPAPPVTGIGHPLSTRDPAQNPLPTEGLQHPIARLGVTVRSSAGHACHPQGLGYRP